MRKKYVRESVLVDPMPDGPYIRLYRYKDKLIDVGLFAAYYGFAKKSRWLFEMNLHEVMGLPWEEANDLAHDFYDDCNDMNYVKRKSRRIYRDMDRCPECGALFVGYNPNKWFYKHKCLVCSMKW